MGRPFLDNQWPQTFLTDIFVTSYSPDNCRPLIYHTYIMEKAGGLTASRSPLVSFDNASKKLSVSHGQALMHCLLSKGKDWLVKETGA